MPAIFKPWQTKSSSSTVTDSFSRCAYRVHTESPWSMTTKFPHRFPSSRLTVFTNPSPEARTDFPSSELPGRLKSQLYLQQLPMWESSQYRMGSSGYFSSHSSQCSAHDWVISQL